MKKYFALSMVILTFLGNAALTDVRSNPPEFNPKALQISTLKQNETKNIVFGVNDVLSMSFDVKNTSSKVVRLGAMTFKADTKLDIKPKNIKAGVFFNGIQQGNVKNFDQNGIINFNFASSSNLMIINPNKNKKMNLIINFNNMNANKPTSGQVRFGVIDIEAITLEDGVSRDVYYKNRKLGEKIDETLLLHDADCDVSRDVSNKQAPMHVCGPLFNISRTGFLRAMNERFEGPQTIIRGEETKVLQFSLHAEKDDILIKKLSFNQDGSLSAGEVRTFRLYDKETGQILAEDVYGDDSYVNFEFSPSERLHILKTNKKQFYITVRVDSPSRINGSLKLILKSHVLEAESATNGITLDSEKNGEYFNLPFYKGYGEVKSKFYNVRSN